jgi:hypothetical protein
MKGNRCSLDSISSLSFNILANAAESVTSFAPAQGIEKIVEEVVFEVEFVKIFNDRAVGKIWFLGTSTQENVKQGEGVVIFPIQPDATGKEFAIQGHEATVVAKTYSEFGNVMAVMQGVLAIESFSADDTAIKTGFGQIMVSHISFNRERIHPRNNSVERVTFVH